MLGNRGVVVDMIIQNVGSSGLNDISFTVSKDDLNEALKIANEFAKETGAREVLSDRNIAKVSVVGVGMKSHSNVAATMFNALAKNNINIQMISTSEIKISCLIDEKDLDVAVRAIHDEFELQEAVKS
jgi:aspartate kinase